MSEQQPLTNEQLWGVPETELPASEQKDYFDYLEQQDVTDGEEEKQMEGSVF